MIWPQSAGEIYPQSIRLTSLGQLADSTHPTLPFRKTPMHVKFEQNRRDLNQLTDKARPFCGGSKQGVCREWMTTANGDGN